MGAVLFVAFAVGGLFGTVATAVHLAGRRSADLDAATAEVARAAESLRECDTAIARSVDLALRCVDQLVGCAANLYSIDPAALGRGGPLAEPPPLHGGPLPAAFLTTSTPCRCHPGGARW